MFLPKSFSVMLLMTLALGLQLLASGCGTGVSDGPARFRVSGKVLFEGKPLPYGTITFEPDASKGNTGPQGFATIKDGVYDTSDHDGKGGLGGATIISIVGMTHETVTEGSEGRFLFNEYRIEKNIPQEDTVLDVEIPTKAVSSQGKRSRTSG